MKLRKPKIRLKLSALKKVKLNRRTLRKARKPLYKSLAVLSIVVGFPLFLQEGVYLAHFLIRLRPFQTEAREKIAPFLDDVRLLAEEPVFPVPTIGSNAASFLNFRLEWAPSTPNLNRAISTNPPKIGLPPPLAQKVRAWGKDFPRHHSDIRYDDFDLTWMAELRRFNYWDILELSNSEEVYENGVVLGLHLTQTLSPQFEELALIGKVRLMRGMNEGNLTQAVEETRQWANLLYSTETLLGEMAAISILRAQNEIWDYLDRHVQTDRGDWVPIPKEQLDRARRVALGYGAWFSVFTPEEVMEKAFSTERSSSALCAGLAKGLLRSLITRPLLEPHVILERNFEESYQALDSIAQRNQGKCRLSRIKEIWKERRARQIWLGLVGDNSWDWINLHLSRHLPWLRKAWGIDLASLFLSNGLEAYR